MRNHAPLRMLLVAGPLVCGPLTVLPAAAQVTYDPRALAPLQQPAAPAQPPAAPPATTEQPAAKKPQPQPRAQRPAQPQTPAARNGTAQPAPAVNPAGPPVPDSRTVVVPTTPPPNPDIPPPIAVPTRPIPAPVPPPVAADAPGAASTIPGGIRVTFAADGSDLNPATEAAIRALVHSVPPFNTTTFDVTAYAAGSEEDPSTPRRLSLARALAVRAALISERVASIRIYVKALGAAAPTFADGPPDRVDIVVNQAKAPAPTAPSAAAVPTQPTPAPSPPAPSPSPPGNKSRP